MKVRNVVLLGCGGFIGSHLLDKLLEIGEHSITGWDFSAEKIIHHLDNPKFTFFQRDAYDIDMISELDQAIGSADVVISLAAICNPSRYNTEPIATISSNFTGLAHLAELCAKHKTWLLHASTSEVYGRTIASYLSDNDYSDSLLYEQTEDDTPLIMGPIQNQRWSYACAKQLSERLIYAYHAECGMPYTMFRPYNFFGPRMDFIPGRNGEGLPRVLACFMTALLDDEPMKLVDGGHARRTFLYIDDAIDALVRMMEMPRAAQNQIFNLGNRNNEVTIRELAHLMRNAFAKVTVNPKYHEHPIIEVTSEEFYGEGYEDCDRRMPDISKARRLLGWVPRYGIEETVQNTVRYFENKFGRKAAAAE